MQQQWGGQGEVYLYVVPSEKRSMRKIEEKEKRQ